MVKYLPAMRETWVRSLGWKDPLEKEMATHCSVLAEEPGGLQSMGSQRVKLLSFSCQALLNSLLILPSPLNLPDKVGGRSPIS